MKESTKIYTDGIRLGKNIRQRREKERLLYGHVVHFRKRSLTCMAAHHPPSHSRCHTGCSNIPTLIISQTSAKTVARFKPTCDDGELPYKIGN